MTIVATNREARRDYDILETFEMGLVLKGTEVKSLRDHRVSLKGSFARIAKEEMYIHNMHISPYPFGNIHNLEPLRTRKLLAHRNQIVHLAGKVAQRHLTLIPLRVFFKHGIAKVEIALAKGRRQYDKREAIHKREAEREIRRSVKLKGGRKAST